MDMKILNKVLDKGTEEINKVRQFMKDNSEMFEATNLKLYDASFYDYLDDFSILNDGYRDYFYDFCEDAYNLFMSWCEDEGIDFENTISRIGRTSSFYLYNFGNIEELLYDYCGYGWLDITDDGKLILYNNDEENAESAYVEAEYIANGFYNYFMETIKDTIKLYNFISDFKNNQIEYFKEYLQYIAEDKEYNLIMENKAIEEAKKICDNIKDKYNMTDDDYITLKKNILLQ